MSPHVVIDKRRVCAWLFERIPFSGRTCREERCPSGGFNSVPGLCTRLSAGEQGVPRLPRRCHSIWGIATSPSATRNVRDLMSGAGLRPEPGKRFLTPFCPPFFRPWFQELRDPCLRRDDGFYAGMAASSRSGHGHGHAHGHVTGNFALVIQEYTTGRLFAVLPPARFSRRDLVDLLGRHQ